MKRSEMIKTIYEELIYSRTPQHGIRITSSPADLKLAEHILKCIEDQGMLPPLDRESYDTLEWGTSILTYHDWEPEDDSDS